MIVFTITAEGHQIRALKQRMHAACICYSHRGRSVAHHIDPQQKLWKLINYEGIFIKVYPFHFQDYCMKVHDH
jgi:hypothetical protein